MRHKMSTPEQYGSDLPPYHYTPSPRPPRPRRRWLRWLVAFVAALLVLALAYLVAVLPAQAAPVKLHHWHGRTPVGFTIAGLQHGYLDQGSLQIIEGQIYTARERYGANTIRLQITQNRLVGANGHRYDPAYMAQIRQVTDYGLSLHLTMVLNAQTEYSPGYPQGQGWADRATMAFWQRIMPVYGHTRGVHFDLFNEPRHLGWDKWQATTQPLVSMIREHSRNPIWLEGPKYASTLEGMPPIKGSRLIYTFHHPGAPWPGMSEHNAGVWNAAFGYLAKAGKPVIDGEFVNDARTYHMPRSELGNYLRYAKHNHIGMIVFGIDHGGLLNRYHAA
jgi:hypothetical protein